MKFNDAVRRHRIELIGLELISAQAKSGLVRNKSIVELYLAAYSDVPWTISGLSNAAQMDRAIIRDHINKGLQSGDYERRAEGFVLSDTGWLALYRHLRQWHRQMHPDIRRFLYRFFKGRGAASPMRDYIMFVLSLDRLARIVKLEFSYIAGLKVIEWEHQAEGISIKDAAARTGFSYSVIHKQYSKMLELGYIQKDKGKHRLTRAGKLHSYRIFISSWRSVTLKEWIVALKMMTTSH